MHQTHLVRRELDISSSACSSRPALPLHLPNKSDIRRVDYVALATKHVWRDAEGYDFYHVGVLFRDEGDNVRLLHLEDHHQLSNNFPAPEYSWVEFSNLDPLVGEQVITACERTWENYGKKGDLGTVGFQYSFLNDTEFLADFRVSATGPGSGFTCSTFVLKLFARIGFVLLDEDSWEARDDDKRWQEFVIKRLKLFGEATKLHVERLEQSIGACRFRPLDLVAAALIRPPATFQECNAKLPEIVEAIPN